jgi:hypothetical protein
MQERLRAAAYRSIVVAFALIRGEAAAAQARERMNRSRSQSVSNSTAGEPSLLTPYPPCV